MRFGEEKLDGAWEAGAQEEIPSFKEAPIWKDSKRR